MPEPSLFGPSLEWVLKTAGFLQRSDLPEAHRMASQAREASVLVPLFRNQGEWHVLFIRRVANQRDRHSDQVAFPGGRRDPDDADEVAVALREADEEIGLQPRETKVVHVLPEYHTSSNYVVTPVVGVVPWPYDYRPQPSEVSRIFSIPLRWLADQRNVELRDKTYSVGEITTALKVVYYNKYDGELLWGATARMTVSLLKALHVGEIDLDDLQ